MVISGRDRATEKLPRTSFYMYVPARVVATADVIARSRDPGGTFRMFGDVGGPDARRAETRWKD